MTREEQIIEASNAYLDDDDLVYGEHDAFMAGAKWADEHPKKVEIPLSDIEDVAKSLITEEWQRRQDLLWDMIERNFRAKFIDKACEWLECLEGDLGYYATSDFIKQFRQAMCNERN